MLKIVRQSTVTGCGDMVQRYAGGVRSSYRARMAQKADN